MNARTSTRTVEEAVAALLAGRMIVVVDDADRENEGDLVLAAETVTEEQMAFLVRHTTGIICVPMPSERVDELKLPQMVEDNTDSHGTAFTVSVDHIDVGTGVSARDRATTVRSLASPGTMPDALRRPGHIFPLRARAGGVLERRGHTEAAVDLLRMAGLSGVGVIGEIVDDDGSMRRGGSLTEFAAEHDLPILHIADLVAYRSRQHEGVELVASSWMPTTAGTFRAQVYRSRRDGIEHLALVMGDVAAAGRSEAGALVRVHSECLTGDIVGSLRCDCGGQLQQAMHAVAVAGAGVIVYLRGHEGRGVGLAHKIRAYAYQEGGLDTVEANLVQGLPSDARSYDAAAAVLADLGVMRARLITNNPIKPLELARLGVTVVTRVALPALPTPENVRYLRTKRDRMGHDLDLPDVGT
ncbi:bifunctional 3,4-dihydroxy-2-butanone-4-phosphate synthase/GTP cyclohydrolase II [Mycobacterium sp. AZCC_0083]|uniref:bifunctional 3,4-dihydroxy-2-butanone-4-phosphate synthase/GTP cyclohydrolase II n=1 Tax=Mycobacterium sp. AZCC_0083 TaxID=2735882 RepID=UPI0016130DF7|nr:bifunctional 3,4-dihydroxy-2-butanone-4-phosphate synthase/GTP cyclohydrolase II [Mycobacterium sp. AZCC_0083]MBB5168337.1 3,4-dihydroxy 2-butanone 4-phosphate synthase/GTP cyclohydrolase II [Mycobacterium sp. AZCC_0083]